MGLDWIAANKEDGTPPEETLGMRRLSKRDPVTVKAFRKIYDSNHDYAEAGHGAQGYRDYWLQPFETILDIESSKDPPPFVEGAGEDVPEFITGGSFAVSPNISFRGKSLGFCGLSDDIVDATYGDDGNQLSVDAAFDLADRLASAIDNKDYHAEHGDREEGVVATITAADLYLRFWAERGHPIYCWY